MDSPRFIGDENKPWAYILNTSPCYTTGHLWARITGGVRLSLSSGNMQSSKQDAGAKEGDPTSFVHAFASPWTVAPQSPPFMEFSRQEYRSGLPFPSPACLHSTRIKPVSLALAGGFVTTEPLGKPM